MPTIKIPHDRAAHTPAWGFSTLLLLITLCAPLRALPQDFSAGLLAGIAATQVDGDRFGGYNKVGPIGGLWVQRTFGDHWAARADLRYIQKGCTQRQRDNGYIQYRLRLNYVELPLSAWYHLNHRWAFGAGASIGYLAALKESDTAGPVPREQQVRLRRYEVSALIAIGYWISPRWAVEARFSYSALPLMATPPNTINWRTYGPYNNVLELMGMFSF